MLLAGLALLVLTLGAGLLVLLGGGLARDLSGQALNVEDPAERRLGGVDLR